MYLLINGKEVTKAQIVRAVREGRAALIDSNGVAALAIHTEPLKFDELYYVSPTKIQIIRKKYYSNLQGVFDSISCSPLLFISSSHTYPEPNLNSSSPTDNTQSVFE